MAAASGNGRYGYGGSWEKTYVFNEIAQFVNMFGGDYFDWTKPENKEAIQFLHDMVKNNQTPIDQIADKYEQMNPKANDGKYGCWFMWGLGTDYAKAEVVPDSDPAKEMYSRYASECNVNGRPMLPQTMEFITDMGTIYQSCMKDEISVDDFCKKAQELVNKYK